MKQKVWTVSVLGNKPYKQQEDMEFFTSDTKAEIVVKLTDQQMKPTSATVTVFNKDDKSLVSEVHPVEGGKVSFPMFTTGRNVIEHGGQWSVQVVFDYQGGKYTSRMIPFNVMGSLLDDSEASLEIIENITNLVLQLEQHVRDAKAKIKEVDDKLKVAEAEREVQEVERVLSELSRIEAEGLREVAEDVREDKEALRQTAEQGREVAEDEREVAESLRDDGEVARDLYETERQVAEDNRGLAEGEREVQEVSRQAKESAREDGEALRTSQESSRVTAEQLRETDETDRSDEENVRKQSESVRESNESARQAFIALVENKLDNGEFDGADLEYIWRGTELGVRKEGTVEYTYVDLKGETGEVDNLTSKLITDALGYTPLDESNFVDTITTVNGKTGSITKADIVALGIPAQDTSYVAGSNIAITDNTISVTGQLGLTESEVKAVKVDKAVDADTVNGHTVSKSVPADAKFTDTIVDISGKVDKVAGKGLSANDYSDAEKAEVAKVKNKAEKSVVDAHLADGTAHGIGDKANLETNEKGTIVGAMNELFTNVSNGKDLVSGAITGVDDSVAIPTEPSFADLAGAIGEISTGKKWASGTGMEQGSSGDEVLLPQLPFEPSIVKLSTAYYSDDPGNALWVIRKSNGSYAGVGVSKNQNGISNVYASFVGERLSIRHTGWGIRGSDYTWIAYE